MGRPAILCVSQEGIERSVILPEDLEGNNVKLLKQAAKDVIGFYEKYQVDGFKIEYEIGEVHDAHSPHPNLMVRSRELEEGVDDEFGEWFDKDELTFVEVWETK